MEAGQKDWRAASAVPVVSATSENPYWDVAGWTFEDPDGYRVVLQRGPWTTGSRDD